ncbi:MAG TPA: DUF971 domain-containing protein [Bacteroidetes bacterium]|nr:DUF971 domain-containing protein [Bacteroidota bacterium]HCN37730.1 DUF971 domain-containing protein [Bacteroidota bacterium]
MKELIKIELKENKLILSWNDNTNSKVNLKKLRDECPCVNCKGESVIFDSYIPIKSPFKPAGFYEIKSIEPVGNYAIQIIWKDGHNTGIYSYDILKKISD